MTLTNSQRKFVLASGSPRRRELMTQLGFEPVVIVADVPEQIGDDETPSEYTRRLAHEKASAVARKLEADSEAPGWILAADTIVVLDGEVLEKPADPEDAVRMLTRLSASVHEVVTAFCTLNRSTGEFFVRETVTRVVFRALDEDTIRRYVATGEPMDKAGAYGIQGLGSALVDTIDGSYFSVVGLPIAQVVDVWQTCGALEGFPFSGAK